MAVGGRRAGREVERPLLKGMERVRRGTRVIHLMHLHVVVPASCPHMSPVEEIVVTRVPAHRRSIVDVDDLAERTNAHVEESPPRVRIATRAFVATLEPHANAPVCTLELKDLTERIEDERRVEAAVEQLTAADGPGRCGRWGFAIRGRRKARRRRAFVQVRAVEGHAVGERREAGRTTRDSTGTQAALQTDEPT